MSTADRLAAVLEAAPSKLKQFSNSEAGVKAGDGRWSKKEILGHLIDSAGNNHQRFVRAQFASHLDFPRYEQEQWVLAQHYQSEPWADMVELWLLLNRHLIHIIRAIPPARLAHTISLGGREPMTLGSLIDDYLRHLEHHLGQLLP